MKVLLSIMLLSLLFVACEKDKTSAMQSCYKGRFIGEGCWTVIQLLEPSNGSLPTSTYGNYDHTFGTANVPEKYKNGQPFYFTVNKVDSNKIYLTYCLPTKYIFEIEN